MAEHYPPDTHLLTTKYKPLSLSSVYLSLSDKSLPPATYKTSATPWRFLTLVRGESIQFIMEFIIHFPETRWDYLGSRDSYSINLHPSPRLISKAYMALIKTFGWQSFTILYQVQTQSLALEIPLAGQRGLDQAAGAAQVLHRLGPQDCCPPAQLRGQG